MNITSPLINRRQLARLTGAANISTFINRLSAGKRNKPFTAAERAQIEAAIRKELGL